MDNHQTQAHDGHLGHSVKRLYHLMGQHFNDVLRPYGVARSQWYMLLAIHNSPGLAQKKLQAALQVESATLTAALTALEHKGWLTREPSPTDRRAKILSLTPAGRRLWKSLPDPITEIRRRMLQGISPQDEQLARHILNRAIHNLES